MSIDLIDDEQVDPVERMWPLDVATGALAGLILYLTVSVLRFDDSRWVYNAYTYVVAVPVAAFIFGLVLRRFVSGYLQKSAQLGFLFSVFVHLLLLILAVRWVIFPHYFPEAFAGVKQDRMPVRKTVSEHHFQTPQTNPSQPDWERPVETETNSRVEPERERVVIENRETAPELELPKMEQQVVPEPTPAVKRQPELTESQPTPSNALTQRTRRAATVSTPMSSSQPIAPEVALEQNVRPDTSNTERIETGRRRTVEPLTSAPVASASAPALMASPQPLTSASSSRAVSDAMPTVGQNSVAPTRQSRSRARQSAPAGAAPAAPTVAVARVAADAAMSLSPTETPLTPTNRSAFGAQLSMSSALAAAGGADSAGTTSASGADYQRSTDFAQAGIPGISSSSVARPTGRRRSRQAGAGMTAAGVPSLIAIATDSESSVGGAPETAAPTERSGGVEFTERRSPAGAGAATTAGSIAGGGPTFEVEMSGGIAGIASLKRQESTGMLQVDAPSVASLSAGRRRAKRKAGGPVVPAGSVVKSVESFDRRMRRTEGGAAPAPSGMVGPATEEAIERGLAFLAENQNEDGSWSLQGLGEDVAFRSDSAATGLCLLAFQGAGYTHKQHQYAGTVAKGIDFLVKNQSAEGSLYRKENPMSDRSVAFYSHGIAALAMCEAYGMTQDEQLRPAAQKAVDFISETQHRKLGGWRYSSQRSADTSVSGWMMMALKSGELSGLDVPEKAYLGIERWLTYAQKSPQEQDRYRYNPFAPNTPAQRHGRLPTPTMTAVGMLMRMYGGWSREHPAMQSAADYLLDYPPEVGTPISPQRDTYYWYYATQVMFHMGGKHWDQWNRKLNPILISGQIKNGPKAGSWDPNLPVPDRWSVHGGRLYVTATNLLNLEVYYRHLPIYDDTAN